MPLMKSLRLIRQMKSHRKRKKKTIQMMKMKKRTTPLQNLLTTAPSW